MTREEFCHILLESKKNTGITTSDICYELKMLPADVRRIELGSYNFRMDRCFRYLKSIGYAIFIKRFGGNEQYYYKDYDAFIDWFSEQLQSRYHLTIDKELGLSRSTLNGYAKKEHFMSIDRFLQIIEYFSGDIELVEV